MGLKTKKPSIYVCHAGLINIEIPLIYKNQCFGAITAGQVLCEDMEGYPADQISGRVDYSDSEGLYEYYKEIKVLSRKQIEATTASLASICNYILQKFAYAQIQQDLAANREKLLLYEKQQIELKHQLKMAQFDALQKQVTPHFIFNVINTISRLLSMKEYDTAAKMLDSFASMMRYSLLDVKSTVMLKQELNYIENFLMIQKIRCGDRIEYELECDPGLREIEVPFFFLQPLVENSIKHGLLDKPEGGKVLLACAKVKDGCVITLEDNGTGIEAGKLHSIKENLLTTKGSRDSEHIGLYNCYNRLKLLFGSNMKFFIESESGKGTAIQIMFHL